MNSLCQSAFTSLVFLSVGIALAGNSSGDTEKNDWDIENSSGEASEQTIDVTEGTWINLDVSPDGETIVFDLLGDLYTMPITGATGGSAPQNLTQSVAWDMQPRFSPDGKTIAFTSDRLGKSGKSGDNIWLMGSDGSQAQQVTNETYRLLNGPAWSPSGDYLVARKHFTSRRSLGAGEMWMYHRDALFADSMGGVQLTEKPTEQKDVNEPVFSPDGRYLYYSEDVSPEGTFQYDKDSNKQIYVVKRLDLDSGDVETYISGPGGACRPVPSPDGKQIAFVRRLGAKTGLHLFDVQSGRVRLVYDLLERDMQEAWAIHGVYSAYAWMPDGKSIVIWAQGKIRRIDVATGKAAVIPFRIQDKRTVRKAVRFPIEVAPDQFDVKMLQDVRVAPNGQQVAFQALGHIYLRELPHGKPRRLTTQTQDFEFMPNWSRDSKYLVYATWNDDRFGAIRVASVDATNPENWRVTQQPGHYRYPVFSPDRKTIVFEKGTGGFLLSPLWSQSPGLYQSNARGGTATLISKQGRRPQFAADTDRVFFLKSNRDKDGDNLGLYSIQLDGRRQRQHYTSSWATDYVISPQAQHVAFVERFNVYLAPFVRTGGTVKLGPKATNLPIRKVSQEAGDSIHFSAAGSQLHWSLGPDLYTISTDTPDYSTRSTHGDGQTNNGAKVDREVDGKVDEKVSEVDTPRSTKVGLGFSVPHAQPTGTTALVGGQIITMQGDEVIDSGTIVVDGNRIVALGASTEIEVPEDARIIRVDGQTIIPGFVDTHAHGSQGTSGITPQHNWVDYARLAFGVTTVHDPSNDTQAIFAASELAKAGLITSPRTFSTGKILYGATGSFKAEIDSLEDAKFHLRRMQAVGAFSVKSYNQPRRDQRQQILAAARELKMMVVPEGGSTFMHNMTMIVDGHTGIEHTLPVQTAYDDVMDLWRNTQVGYTPTLCVAYGGLGGENYWYEVDDLWLHPRLREFIPPHVLTPRSRRRSKAPIEDYNHIRVAEIARQVVEQGGLVQAGGHGQLNGICTHWELWSFVQGGMTPRQALQCGTIFGARYLGLDNDIGSLQVGKLADLIVLQKGANPLRDIRDTEQIEYVMANGRVFAANRMNELGSAAPRKPFFWSHPGYGGPSTGASQAKSCSCQR